MKTIKIAINLGNGFKAIKAEPVEILGFNLALHKTPNKTGWSVTHVGTGLALVSKASSKDEARRSVALKVRCYTVEKFQAILDKTPVAPAVETLEDFGAEEKPAKVDLNNIVALISHRAGGLAPAEELAVKQALNSRTGQLKAKCPSAFGSPQEKLAAAAWQGIQPNGFKISVFTVLTINRSPEAFALYDKLSKIKWPAALDKDKLALVNAGVW